MPKHQYIALRQGVLHSLAYRCPLEIHSKLLKDMFKGTGNLNRAC